ncbi:helix-turn-helix domain-containing protein [Amycolatopsis saalfeldensis]|uniref:Transcriptional regulator, contains XRE-family HTH domain n=1 Tax=Amycolatopsis saalfeldensis TaxID=394193 RepID=A0A1H8YMU1_9PSEU|nr:helix-turn-helix transcriptional regulator [Amycolatopsis saalfeldensis]SEP53507.1 Transcriptional regulator, contains XRE-family HTH domain [Amycolatopsis saalfeldensis]
MPEHADTGKPLGAFLRARRELLDPAELGLPDYGRRRVPGLRREELAQLAGVSPHYYARLEQGRDRNPSAVVLEAIAKALRLDEDALAHLRQLAAPPPRRRLRDTVGEKVRAGLAELIGTWTEQPAVVIGRHRDVLAANDLAAALNPGFTPGRNLLRDVFLDPAARDVYLDWTAIAHGAVAGVRSTVGSELDDPRLTELIGELSLKSGKFRAMWARHDVEERTAGIKRFNNPLVGEVVVNYQALSVTGAVGQILYIFSAEPGSAQSLTPRRPR